MKKLIIILLGVASVGCNTQKEYRSVSINDLANRYYEETISMYPQYSYFYDIPIEDHGFYGSNLLTNSKKGEEFEDHFSTELLSVDETSISKKKVIGSHIGY